MSTDRFNSLERRSIAALASVYGLRMFGLFLILPVLSIYTEKLDNATPVLMGIALGVYGISQAVLQIPFGVLSDKFGRKPMIYIGLGIFAIGSMVAAIATTIEGVIIGRALQGSGAIATVILALTSDLTRENQRTKAMALIGVTIGLAFLLALMAAPVLAFLIGVKGIFVLTAILAVLSIVLIWKVVPTPMPVHNLEVKPVPKQMLGLLRHPQLIRLDLGIFILHFVLTMMFVVIPIVLLNDLKLATSQHWQVYFPALIGSIVFMMPLIILSARRNLLPRIFMAAICIVLFAQCLLLWRSWGVMGITFCLFVFFWGFNLLEAMLPSLVSRLAPAAGRGSAMGVYNTFQFTGVFFGGLVGGTLYGEYGATAVFAVCGLILLLWAYLAQTAPEFRLLDSLVVQIGPSPDSDCRAQLAAVEGVEEVVIFAGETIAYLKVDKQRLDQAALDAIAVC